MRADRYPMKRREKVLCEQTLCMLKSYGYDMSMVHIFVDATHVRESGCNEYDVYFKHLRAHGFRSVHVHPGGVGLRKQYERIFQFFVGEPEMILTSDMCTDGVQFFESDHRYDKWATLMYRSP